MSRLRLLLDPRFHLFAARRLLEAVRQLARDYIHHQPLPAHRLVRGAGASIGRRAILSVEPGVAASDPARFEIGERAFIEDGAELGLIPGARLVVGRNSSIHRGCVILGNVRIGANCIFSYNIYAATGMHVIRERPNWLIKDQDDAYPTERLTETVWIDDDVWIGWSVFVRTGTHIGRGAVIGANASVMSHVEPYAIYAGVPARKIGERLAFAPPGIVNADDDGSLPYFYAGFLDDQTSLRESRKQGGIRLAGAALIVLQAAANGKAKVWGRVNGEFVDLRVSVGGAEVLQIRLAHGMFEIEIPVRQAVPGLLPPQLERYTAIGLDAGTGVSRLAVLGAEITGS